MKINELQPPPMKNILFQRDQYLKVPELSGCYVLVNNDNDILYIGQAVNFNQRFQQHLDNPEKTQPTREGTAWKFWYLEYDIKKLSFLENTWLQEFQQKEGHLPILNKIQAPIG
jgi:predicted GIY-YIG superfamily endonuclease